MIRPPGKLRETKKPRSCWQGLIARPGFTPIRKTYKPEKESIGHAEANRLLSLLVKPSTKDKLQRVLPAGIMVNSPGGTGVGDIEGPLEIFFAGLLGALAGFVLGLLIGVFTRIATMNAARGCTGGIHWAAYGAGAGALALAIIEFID